MTVLIIETGHKVIELFSEAIENIGMETDGIFMKKKIVHDNCTIRDSLIKKREIST